MSNTSDYTSLSDDDLFEALQHAAIREHEASEGYATDPEWREKQHRWADEEAAISEEITRRGRHLQQRYIELLNADHPSVRLSAALAVRKFAPKLALPVLEELHDSAKYGGHIAFDAGTTIRHMRK